jgi:hypothetical protein
MMAEKITCLKRDAQSDLHFEMKIWKILIHPSIFFRLLPIPSKYQSLPQAPQKTKKNREFHQKEMFMLPKEEMPKVDPPDTPK